MYVYYFVHLRGAPHEWAQRLVEDGTTERSSAGLPNGPHADALGRLQLRSPRRAGPGFAIPFTWDAPGVFVGLNGEFSIQPVEEGMTQLTVSGSYRPDQDGDRSEVHRRVEARVKRALDSFASLDL